MRPQANISELAQHAAGRRVLLELLNPGQNRYVPPFARAIVAPPVKMHIPKPRPGAEEAGGAKEPAVEESPAEPADAEGPSTAPAPEEEKTKKKKKKAAKDEDEDADLTPELPAGPLGASKKDPLARRTEILSGGLGEALCTLCGQEAGVLLRSQHGSDVAVEVAAGGSAGALEAAVGGAAPVDAVHAAIVAEAALPRADPADASAGPSQEHLLESFFGSRALRRLVQRAAEPDAYPAVPRFLAALWRGALQGRCGDWFDSHAAKVLAAVLEHAASETRPEIEAELRERVPDGDVPAWARQFAPQGPAAPADKQAL